MNTTPLTLTTNSRPLRDISQENLQKRNDDLVELSREITIASNWLVKVAEEAVGAAIIALPPHLWMYFGIGDGEAAVAEKSEQVFDDLEAVENELKERRLDEQDGKNGSSEDQL